MSLRRLLGQFGVTVVRNAATWAGVVSGVATVALAAKADRASPHCRVTVVRAATRPPRSVPASFNYGNTEIAVALLPANGRLVAGRLPAGGSRATINADGSIYAKYGWWRSGSVKPIITGSLVNDRRTRLRTSVPGGYGAGFQATALTLPTTGWWRITGRFANKKLVFTVSVTKSALGP
jgi:hypothetical protein